MTQRKKAAPRSSFVVAILCAGLFLLPWWAATASYAAQPSPAAVSAFSTYAASVEARLAQQHRQPRGFLAFPASVDQNDSRLRRGELIVERLTPPTEKKLSGAMLYHWRGTAFAPGAKAADFERIMRDFNAYPQHFSPQVVQARVLSQQNDHIQAIMRVRQKHVITVVMDTSYDIAYGRLDRQHGYSISRSAKIDEIDSAGMPGEHALTPNEQHGFLWRLNTYWSYEERDGGLYMQIESISLTRSIPTGLGWAIGPFVESVPRESLEFTLRSVCNALRK
jgi:hypothetical protein